MNTTLQYLFQGLAAGGFYAVSALGLAVIFGVLGVVNFSHGAMYMLGAVGASLLSTELGLGFWAALVIIPLALFMVGVLIERVLVRWLLHQDPLYNFLLTFGVALVTVDLVKITVGASGFDYGLPAGLQGKFSLGDARLPTYQLFLCIASALVCLAVWAVLSKTRVGMIVRAATEDADRTRAFGINVRLWVTPVFGFGVALAGLAGVMSAPFRAINADMGGNFVIILFAVVVIGGLGSIAGAVAVAGGVMIGLVEAFGQAYASAYAQVLIFVVMAAVILVRPNGLFNREATA